MNPILLYKWAVTPFIQNIKLMIPAEIAVIFHILGDETSTRNFSKKAASQKK